MSDSVKTYAARTYSTGIYGRAICNSRHHHFVADDVTVNEAVTAGEYFLAGITACAVNMIGRVAKEEMMVSFERLEVKIEGTYDRDKRTNDVTLFQTVKMQFEFNGINENQAQKLVAIYKERCPLYGTLAAATPAVKIEVLIQP